MNDEGAGASITGAKKWRELRLFSLKNTRLREDLISVWEHLQEKEDAAKLFLVMPSERTRGNRQRGCDAPIHRYSGLDTVLSNLVSFTHPGDADGTGWPNLTYPMIL